jgi:hypothetical protein
MGERAVTAGAETTASTAREARRTEEIRAKEVDPSPHYEGRAQPGDVLGVETGGERTHIGETAEDENDRRRDAEKTDAKRRR